MDYNIRIIDYIYSFNVDNCNRKISNIQKIT